MADKKFYPAYFGKSGFARIMGDYPVKQLPYPKSDSKLVNKIKQAIEKYKTTKNKK